MLLLGCFIRLHAMAQPPAGIGSWTDHLSYNQATHVVENNGLIYTSTPNAIFLMDPKDQSIQRLSRFTGLSGAAISTIAAGSGTIVVGYANGNVDIIQNDRVENVDAIYKNTAFTNKTIFEINIYGDEAYLCTGFGIVVIDLLKHEVSATYIIGNAATAAAAFSLSKFQNNWYASTAEGIKRAAVTGTNLEDYSKWEAVTSEILNMRPNTFQLTSTASQLLYRRDDSIFTVTDTLSLFYTSTNHINSIKLSNAEIVVLESANGSGLINFVNVNGTVVKTVRQNNTLVKPIDVISDAEDLYIADSVRGLVHYSSSRFELVNPSTPGSGHITAMTGSRNIIAAAFEPTGLSIFENREWANVDSTENNELRGNNRITELAIDPLTGDLWAGSVNDGLLQVSTSGQRTKYKEGSFISPDRDSPPNYTVSGIAFDGEATMWISNSGATDNLVAYTKKGDDVKFRVPLTTGSNTIGKLLVDDVGQKWIIVPGNGLICFNSGTDLANPADDQWRAFSSGAGNGNLPTNSVLSIAKDKNNFIWIGTSSGIGVIQCPELVFTNQGCETVLPVVQQGNFNGYLFRGESVQAIAVDGADRKWIGTKNGIWLISPDGEKTIEHFTTDNSPLPDNDVQSITIDPSTGEVYIATAIGLCSYRGSATEASAEHHKILIFPNPVPPGYSGTIGITGVPSNSFVRITELNGRLVYQARSNGAMMTWNGRDSRGQKISTGVYLVLVTDQQRKESLATKIIFISK